MNSEHQPSAAESNVSWLNSFKRKEKKSVRLLPTSSASWAEKLLYKIENLLNYKYDVLHKDYLEDGEN